MIYISTVAFKRSKSEKSNFSMFELLYFFVPLGLTFLLISVTHSLFNAALARLPSPEIYLAGFTVAKSLLQVIQNPIAMIKQTVTALISDSKSYFKVRKFVLTLVSIIVFSFVILAYSGGSRWVFKNVMGIESDVLNQAVIILRVFVFFPAALTLRNFMQAIAIKFKKTPLVTIATIARVAFVVIIIFSIKKLMFIPPGILAGMMFLGAIITEALTMTLGVKLTIKNIPKSLDKLNFKPTKVDNIEVNNRIVIHFFAPLVVTSLINSLANPIINSGLARTINPEVAISAYAVAWSVGVLFISPLMNFHQVPLNFIENDKDRVLVKKFAVYVAITLSTMVGMIAFTPIGSYILSNLIGVTEEICIMAMGVLKVMTILPLIMVVRQYYWGILMKKRMTKYVRNGKIVNLTALIISIFVITLLKIGNPAIVGVLGKISSEFFESLYLYKVSKRNKICEVGIITNEN